VKKAIFFLLFLLVIPLALAVEYPKSINYVSDYANIISPEYEQLINQLAREIEDNTTVELAILVVDNLQGLDRETYVVEIFKQWGIGKKDINNGLLILVALEEQQYRIEVGYGLEPIITDATAGRIGRNNLVPNFKAGDYGKGIHEAILDINGFLNNDPSIISQYAKPDKIPITAFLYPLILLVFFIGAVIKYFTKNIQSKKKRLGIRIGIGGTIFIALLFLSVVLAAIVIFIYMIALLPGRGMRGPGLIYLGGFGGGFRGGGGFGGGFGGFGGGFSGGGGAGGGW